MTPTQGVGGGEASQTRGHLYWALHKGVEGSGWWRRCRGEARASNIKVSSKDKSES